MSINEIFQENNLVTCPHCDVVMSYSDYLVHYVSDDIYNYDTSSGMDIEHIDIGIDLDLYNPMIDRGFNNISNNTTNNYFNTIENNNINIQNNSDLPFDIGLGIENLSLYSTKIPIAEDSYCVICMNTYEKGNEFYLMKCLHSFCDECSKRWFDFKSVCPLCKTNMKKM